MGDVTVTRDGKSVIYWRNTVDTRDGGGSLSRRLGREIEAGADDRWRSGGARDAVVPATARRSPIGGARMSATIGSSSRPVSTART